MTIRQRVAEVSPPEAVLVVVEAGAGLGGVAWHPAGTLLAAGCMDAKVYVWDTAAGTSARAASLSAPTSSRPLRGTRFTSRRNASLTASKSL